jgi:hypothetical protein
MAALADVCSSRNKDFWLSMGLLASSGGFVIGSALSGLLANNRIVSWFTIHTPLHATVLLASLDFVLLSLLFREFPRPHSVRQTRLSLASGVFSLVSAFRNRGLREVSWVFLLQSLARGAYFFFIAHFIMDSFDVTSTNVSLFMSLMGLGPCISFAVVMPLLRKRYSTRAGCQLEPSGDRCADRGKRMRPDDDAGMVSYSPDLDNLSNFVCIPCHFVYRPCDSGHQRGDIGPNCGHQSVRLRHDRLRGWRHASLR